jgi:hypothetical protein
MSSAVTLRLSRKKERAFSHGGSTARARERHRIDGAAALAGSRRRAKLLRSVP